MIGLALVRVLVFAALGGIFVPLTLNRLGVDPAVSSGPFVTSITDIVGFFAFLGIARVVQPVRLFSARFRNGLLTPCVIPGAVQSCV